MDRPQPLGRKIASLRKARGWTQDGLALHLHRSASWVTKVERGVLHIDSMSTLREIAKVFNVAVSELSEEVAEVANPVAMDGNSELVRLLDRPARMFTPCEQARSQLELTKAVLSLRRTYNQSSSKFLSAATELPRLIIDATALAENCRSAHARSRAYATLANLYRLGALEFRHRYDHLHARLALDRAAAAAEYSDNPILIGSVAATLTTELMIGGHPEEATALAEETANLVSKGPLSIDAEHVIGVLRLYGAQSAARSGSRMSAMRLLSAAETVARTDTERYFLIFGPANIAVQRAGISVDLERPADALEACSSLDPGLLRSTNRVCYFQLHKARAYGMVGALDGAVVALTAAWQAAPHIVVNDPLGRRQVSELLDKKRTFDAPLRRIAHQMNLL
ncbi:helix-turn-helix domain-containing protein [Nocardia amamiensis]|uniref:helix-turn-helix domain-containing protein n=1 Tax=Nocardia amamiensis TaxID=404578 RepID=UPI0008375B0E|nr:helix-turn-helix transcriptional regulator [Nocardia amamiensis]